MIAYTSAVNTSQAVLGCLKQRNSSHYIRVHSIEETGEQKGPKIVGSETVPFWQVQSK